MVDWNSLILWSDPNSPLTPGRPINGRGTPNRVSCLVPSQLVYPSACGLHSFMWLEFDVCTDRVGDRWGVVAWEFFTRPRVTCGALPESPWLSLRSPCPNVDTWSPCSSYHLITLFFWSLEPSEDLAFICFPRPIAGQLEWVSSSLAKKPRDKPWANTWNSKPWTSGGHKYSISEGCWRESFVWKLILFVIDY